MPDGGKATPISPGIITRVSGALRTAISTVASNGWFGPNQPIRPMAPPDVTGRRFDYPTGYNLSFTPGGNDGAGISFEELRALADNCDILRSVIETRKEQMKALDWNIKLKPRDDDSPEATDEQNKRINEISAFFQKPDQRNNWTQWLGQLLEDMFVIDAACIYKRPDRKGRLWGLEPLNGASIKILLDDGGRYPLPPDPAYQQILKGVPATDYTSDELLYLMNNPRTHKVYGYSQVEQVVLSVNIAIRRALHQLEYYREGSQPDAFYMLPDTWNQEQVGGFQKYWDGIASGNSAVRRRLKFMPGGKYQEAKQPQLKDEYDEWLARIICYVFSVPPTPFIKQMNRATAESAHDAALEEGLAPLQRWVTSFMNQIIALDFNSPDLVFDWVDDREQDPKVSSDIRVQETKAGIISIDEAREQQGLDAMGGAYAEPQALIATGFVAPITSEEQSAARQTAQETAATAAANPTVVNEPIASAVS